MELEMMRVARIPNQTTGATLLATLVLTVSAAVPVAAETAAVDPAVALLPAGVEVLDLPSESVGDTFRIFIGRPPAGIGAAEASDEAEAADGTGGNTAAKHPVIYVLDGNGMFLDVLQTVRWLSRSAGVPPAVVVGIGYPVDSFWTTMNLRSRDYTPTVDRDFIEVANRTMWPGMADAATATSGRADGFLDFIESELMPLIENEFDGNPDDSTIVGHSFGGLLGSYALVSRPGLFQRYVITSPSLWWDGGFVPNLEREVAAKRTDLPARVFFSVGAFESEDIQLEKMEGMPPERIEAMREFMEHIGKPYMVRRLLAFENTLAMRAYPGLHMQVVVFEEENHGSVRFGSASRGLRYVFAE
jgi:predicted alpha/beta superfamily hydrolase